eukprot:TRINITY_DN4218_c0_g1_i19.p3 TRINITY_DN4218_c0_g1~~TRINITY_DN4218_c0_g1_i19.p3  ORF type:complete len:309 (-),score=124.95 TRINITY_DN4218_c0_g1_i19:3911-4837(-)
MKKKDKQSSGGTKKAAAKAPPAQQAKPKSKPKPKQQQQPPQQQQQKKQQQPQQLTQRAVGKKAVAGPPAKTRITAEEVARLSGVRLLLLLYHFAALVHAGYITAMAFVADTAFPAQYYFTNWAVFASALYFAFALWCDLVGRYVLPRALLPGGNIHEALLRLVNGMCIAVFVFFMPMGALMPDSVLNVDDIVTWVFFAEQNVLAPVMVFLELLVMPVHRKPAISPASLLTDAALFLAVVFSYFALVTTKQLAKGGSYPYPWMNTLDILPLSIVECCVITGSCLASLLFRALPWGDAVAATPTHKQKTN